MGPMSTEPQTDTDAVPATLDVEGQALPAVREPRRRRIDRGLLVASLAIALGVVIVGYGLIVSVTGDEATKLPAEIDSVAPVPDAVQVLSQTNVVVDLAARRTVLLPWGLCRHARGFPRGLRSGKPRLCRMAASPERCSMGQ